MNEKRKIYWENNIFEYEISRTKRKSTVLVFKNDKWILKTNNFLSVRSADEFVVNNINVIIKKYNEYKNVEEKKFCSIFKDDYFYYLGNKYLIVLIKSNRNEILIDNNNFNVLYTDIEECDELVRKFIKKECNRIIEKAINKYKKFLIDYDEKVNKITVRWMDTRWGSCNYKLKKINISANLIHYNIDFFNAVIIHELVHLVQPNHSKEFYRIIYQYEPDYDANIELVYKK